MKTSKKVLSLVLAVLMFVSVVPSTVIAAELQAYCVRCNKVATAIEGRTISPTCENDGYTELICKDCSVVLGVTNWINPNGHVNKILDGVEPTCTTEGYVIKTYCEICHHILEYDEAVILKPTGHSFNEIVFGATCSSNGKKIKECTICGYSELVDSIPSVEHIMDKNSIKIIAPTCTNAGMSTGICTMCDCEITKIIPATGHNFVINTNYKNPTCKNAGNYGEKYCNRCKETFYFDANGNSISEEYVALNPLNAIGHTDDNNDYICDRCDAILQAPDPEEPQYYIENGYYYTVDNGEATVILVDETVSGDIIIPSTLGGYTVTAIGESAFSECYWITGVSIPDTVKSIADYGFSICFALKEIVIPESITSIGQAAFAYCLSLEKMIVKNSSVEIGEYVGYTDMIIKEGYTTAEFVEKTIASLELEYGSDEYNALIEELEAMVIYTENPVSMSGLTIYSHDSSTAKDYAYANGITFKTLEEYEEENHTCTFGEWYTVTEATVFSEGEKRRDCEDSKCDKFETRTTAKLENAVTKDETTKVEITYTDDNFDKAVDVVVIEDKTTSNIALADEYKNFTAYDISLETDGAKVQPNGKVIVKLPIPADFNAETIAVYYIDNNGNKTLLESKAENGYVVFETDHFSVYAIVDESSKIEKPAEPEVPVDPTPDEPAEPDTPEDTEPPAPCSCKCHAGGIKAFFFKLFNFFAKLFNPAKRVCACGVKH